METLAGDIRATAHAQWNRFLAAVDPWRPDLHRYCRRLTGDVWDTEDLIQDTLEQAYARLGALSHDVRDTRAYLLRIASNLWVDRQRRATVHDRAITRLQQDTAWTPSTQEEALAVRAAAERLLTELAPQERAALMLKEVFEFSLAEIADLLGTSTGAVKSALHRGRRRLTEPASSGSGNSVSRTVVEQFVDRFNARDRSGMLAIMLDGASIQMGGVDYEIGRDGFDREPGWLYYNLLTPEPRWEVATYQDEPIVLFLPTATSAIGSIMRFATVDDRIASIRVYAFCPEAIREVAAGLGRPAAPLGLYRFDPSIFQHPAPSDDAV